MKFILFFTWILKVGISGVHEQTRSTDSLLHKRIQIPRPAAAAPSARGLLVSPLSAVVLGQGEKQSEHSFGRLSQGRSGSVAITSSQVLLARTEPQSHVTERVDTITVTLCLGWRENGFHEKTACHYHNFLIHVELNMRCIKWHTNSCCWKKNS